MERNRGDRTRVNRRTILWGLGATALGAGVISSAEAGVGVTGTSGDDSSSESYVIQQGDRCIPITPLEYRDTEITEFYGYEPSLSAENPRQSQTPVGLEENGVSQLFLYRGPEGLSLVVIHGDETGGAATFTISGLPEDGEWTVQDDSYDGATDEFDVDQDPAVIDWAWGSARRNDGGAFTGLGDEFEVTIEPAFNDAATLEPFSQGDIESWRVLSGDISDLETTELSLDEPVTIRTGSCDTAAGDGTAGFEPHVSFDCTAVTIDAPKYDKVYLNFADGTDASAEGPFSGKETFRGKDDEDHTGTDEVIRSVTIVHGDTRVRKRNPNFKTCLQEVEPSGTTEPGDSG